VLGCFFFGIAFFGSWHSGSRAACPRFLQAFSPRTTAVGPMSFSLCDRALLPICNSPQHLDACLAALRDRHFFASFLPPFLFLSPPSYKNNLLTYSNLSLFLPSSPFFCFLTLATLSQMSHNALPSLGSVPGQYSASKDCFWRSLLTPFFVTRGGHQP